MIIYEKNSSGVIIGIDRVAVKCEQINWFSILGMFQLFQVLFPHWLEKVSVETMISFKVSKF